MGIDRDTAQALLAWQIELGADEAILDTPVDRFALPAQAQKPAAPAPPVTMRETPPVDPVVDAREMAAAAADLAALEAALARYPHCELKLGAQNLVFADGNPEARVMIIGEAPGRDEDRLGRPFVGRAGQLLDRMLAAIGHDRAATAPDSAVYITNILPWRPPQNRDPKPEEVAMMLPFVERHVALADPDVLVLMGNHACQGVLGRRGITRLRGQWTEALGRATLPMLHPAYLLRNPIAKREAWADLLALKAQLAEQR
ncbi:MAG: uracil-DNA glycosylase [Pseudomonadota bacterium]